MTQLGRNDPCPCGSGKKYKKCCQRKGQEVAAAQQQGSEAVGKALSWLSQHYPEEMAEAVQSGFLCSLGCDRDDLLGDLPPDLGGMVESNIGEWLLTDAELEVDGEPTLARELLFAPGGLILPAAGRAWLEEVARRPMGLYEVQKVTPGVGVEVTDLLGDDADPVWVVERLASKSLVAWDTFGARLARRSDRWVFTGALYPLSREAAELAREELLEEREGEDWDSPSARDLIHEVICDHWLYYLVGEPVMPEVVDASTGEPMLLTTLHYRVRDWARLAAALKAEPDVVGDRAEGWIRFEDSEDSLLRDRAVLYPREPDGIKVFCRTGALADVARAWFDKIVGDAVEYLIREVVDPAAPKAWEAASKTPQKRLSPEVEAEVIDQVLRKHYANWADEPIPALDGRPPRECLATAEGRRAVVNLLKSYEQNEARRVREQGGEAFDFGFLWEQLGLPPEG